MKLCERCDSDISDRHHQTRFCSECRKRRNRERHLANYHATKVLTGPCRLQRRLGYANGKVLREIDRSIRLDGKAPTLRELTYMCGMDYPSTVLKHIGRLERLGLVMRIPRTPRSLSVTEAGRAYIKGDRHGL